MQPNIRATHMNTRRKALYHAKYHKSRGKPVKTPSPPPGTFCYETSWQARSRKGIWYASSKFTNKNIIISQRVSG